MRTIRWGDGTRFEHPNAYWGSPSYVLQPGDDRFGAFPGDDVKLRTEFQVGINDPQDLASVIDRAGKTLVAARKYVADLKMEGWIPADGTALEGLGEVAIEQDEAVADRAQFTAALTRAANALYKLCLSVQNAARLQYHSTKPGTEAARLRFLLETFPPRDRNQPDGGTQTDPEHPPQPPAANP